MKIQPCSYESKTMGSIAMCNSRALLTIKRDDLEALKQSIRKYGLLNPFVVALLPKKPIIDFMSQEQKYAIIDGQRRYIAINEWIKRICMNDREENEVRKHVLIPCLVYPYKHFKEMQRHSIEDNKFGVRPKTEYLDTAERMTFETKDKNPKKQFVKIRNKFYLKDRKESEKREIEKAKEQAKLEKENLKMKLKELEQEIKSY